jgi:hypothetical protein
LLDYLLRRRLNVRQGLLLKDELKIGNEILAYQVDHPKAQDTLEGIVEWRLLEQEITFETTMVKEDLSELVTKGLILVREGTDSRPHYTINQRKYEKIKKFLNILVTVSQNSGNRGV